MRTVVWVAVCLIAAAVAARGDDQADAKALVDRALEAHGGVERLTRPRAYTVVVEMTSKSKRAPAGAPDNGLENKRRWCAQTSVQKGMGVRFVL